MDHSVALLMLDLAIIPLLALAFGSIAARLGQPPVIGEILAGLLLGATILHSHATAALFPTQVRSFLTCIADVGLAAFMFLVGAEIDHAAVRGSGRIVFGTALGATLVPFGLGSLLALYLARSHAQPGRHLEFVLFVGVAMSVTAFPVLARIIADRGLGSTLIGSIALSTAAVCDVLAWTALAVVQAIGGSGKHPWQVAFVVPFIAVSFLVIRPLLRRLLIDRASGTEPRLDKTSFSLVLAGLLASAAVTQLCGLHFIFGAFLFGLVLPRDAFLLSQLRERLDVTALLLLPVYFVVAGLSVDLSGFGATDLLVLALIVVTAVVGKFGGTLVGAKLQGLGWRSSCLLATLMNTRGLTELVVLSVGLQMGVLGHKLYALMVLMALITTAMSGPLARRLAVPEPASAAVLDPTPA